MFSEGLGLRTETGPLTLLTGSSGLGTRVRSTNRTNQLSQVACGFISGAAGLACQSRVKQTLVTKFLNLLAAAPCLVKGEAAAGQSIQQLINQSNQSIEQQQNFQVISTNEFNDTSTADEQFHAPLN